MPIEPAPILPLTYPKAPDRINWWIDARLGCSFHWGLYSIPARGEWVRSSERLTIESYQPYFDEFNPVAYDPAHWARVLKRAGMKYAILTTKHHDGFCLFDSALTQYKSTNTPCGKDLVRGFVDAMRAEGLRVGLYYSLVDWHHPDYPAWGDRQHPMRHNPAYKDRPHNWDNYVRYLHGQVRELLTNYGRLDMLLFDFSYRQFTGEKWGATELVRMIRSIQPDIVLNDRLGTGVGGNIKESNPPLWAGDFDTCELNTPHRIIRNLEGQAVPWDLWITHSNSWCHSGRPDNIKSAPDIIRALVNCVSKGGNLTFNLGPDALGRLDQTAVRTLEQVGDWLAINGESIYGCTAAEGVERPDWGRFTISRDGRRLYAHIIEQPMGHLTMPGLRGRIRRPRILRGGHEAYLGDFWNLPVQTFGQPADVFFNFNRPIQQTYLLPDPIDTVVQFDVVPPDEQLTVASEQTAKPDSGEPFA